MSVRQTVTIVLLVIAIGSGWRASGRSEASGVFAQERPLFSSGSELVVLHLTIKDRDGELVPDLSKEAFRLFEDDQPQTIRFLTSQDAPVTVGLVLDASGSMQAISELVVAAGVAFAETSNRQDELFVLGFNEHVRATLPPGDAFTRDLPTFRGALARAISARGKTAFFDAVVAGLDHVNRGTYERKVLVVVSDGGDNASQATFDQVLRQTQASNVVIYTVGVIDPADREANPGRLKRLAEASGGEPFLPRRGSDVTEVLRHIARDIRNTYTVGYVSSNPSRDGSLRTVRVDVRPPSGRGRIEVRTRKRYLAGTAPAGTALNAP